MDQELAAINDAELALIKRAIEENLEKKLEGAESAGTVAAEQAIASRGLLTLVDVKLALLPRIGRGVEGVFSAYVRSLRADGVGTVEPVSGVDAVEADVRKAARALLAALGYCELSGKYGATKRCSAALADYFYYIWRRSYARCDTDTIPMRALRTRSHGPCTSSTVRRTTARLTRVSRAPQSINCAPSSGL